MTALTVTGARLDDAVVGLRAVDGTITELGPGVASQAGDEHLDARGMAICPGLVNGHTHAAMTLLRGYGGDLPLMEWLQTRIWPAEAKLTGEDVYWGTRLACLEMIRSGTTRFWDMYWHQHDVARAVLDAGIRSTVGQPILEFDGAPEGARPQDASEGLARLRDEFGSRITGSLSPHAIYTVSEDALRLVADLSAAHDAPIHIHLAETRQEVTDCVAAHGCRPVEYLDRLGALHERTIIAHGVWLEPDELALVAERGATIVTNPSSNMKLAVGRAFPYPHARDAGVAIGLGTDGAASNNALDLLAEIKALALLQKHASGDPAMLPAPDAWDIVTGRHAPALGATPLEVGEPCDFLLVDMERPELVPAPFLDAAVYSGAGPSVDTVVVDGRVLMRDRHVEGVPEVLARVRETAERVRR
ncbi:MAG: amidohydrolase [Actinobacteria bacterium]|nr:amidohydrolase [Actinomycetota bacterium]